MENEARVLIEGIIETDRRKAELLAALAPLSRDPTVRINLQTVAEALKQNSRPPASPAGAPNQLIEKTDPADNAIAAAAALRHLLAGWGCALCGVSQLQGNRWQLPSSFAQKMVNGELTGPITSKLLARGAFYFEDRSSFRNNAGSTNSHAVGNLLYRATDNHRFSSEYEFINQRLPGNRLRGVPVDAASNFLTNIEWSANEPTDFIKMIARVLQLRGEHNLSKGWNADYTFRYLEYENNDKYHEARGLNAATATGRTMRREFRNFFRWNNDWSLNGNLSKVANGGGFGIHTLLFAVQHTETQPVVGSGAHSTRTLNCWAASKRCIRSLRRNTK